MDRYKLNDEVIILAPFGDGVTKFTITDIMAINSEGGVALEGDEVIYYQYCVGDSYYAEQFLGA
jgi:hypothetical protein